jgi:hypothetical protein
LHCCLGIVAAVDGEDEVGFHGGCGVEG